MWERAIDRLATARRRRAFPVIDAVESGGLPDPWPRILEQASPGVLNVLATEPRPDLGGVQTQFTLRFEAERRHRPGALLFPRSDNSGDGYRLELSARGETADRRLAIHWSATHDELGRVLRDAADRVGAQLVHVEQPLGLPLDAWKDLERPLVISLHDFGMFCRRPHLLERPQMEFCDFSRDNARCTACLGHSWPTTQAGDQERRRTQCGSILGQAAALIFPSDYLRRTYLRLYPSLDPQCGHVVAPPSFRPTLPAARPRQGLRRIAFVGSVKPHKGSEIFEQLVSLDGAATFRWHAFGGGDAAALRRLDRRGVKIHGYYRSGSLANRLSQNRIDLALVLSVWPETYCMVVDECLHAGVPVVAFDLGAPADRLRDAGGLLVPPQDGGRGVFRAIESLATDRASVPDVAAADLPTAETAADAVRELYSGLQDRS